MSSLKTQRISNNHGLYPYDRIDSPHLIGGHTEDSNSTCLQHVNQPKRPSKLKKSCRLHAPQPVKIHGFEPAAPSAFFDSISSSDTEDNNNSSDGSPEPSNESDNDGTESDIQSELTKIFTGMSNSAAFDSFEEEYSIMPGFSIGFPNQPGSVFDDFDYPSLGMSPRLSNSKSSMEDSMPVLGFSPGPIKFNSRPPSRAPNPCPVKERIDMDHVMLREELMSKNRIDVQQEEFQGFPESDFGYHNDMLMPSFDYYRNRRNSEPLVWIPIRANSDM